MNGPCSKEFLDDPDLDDPDAQYYDDDYEEDGGSSSDESDEDLIGDGDQDTATVSEETNGVKKKNSRGNGASTAAAAAQWNETDVMFRISGSLQDFFNDPEKAKSMIRSGVSGIFASKSGKNLLKSIAITSVNSDYPCSLQLQVEGINVDGGKKQCFSSDGVEGVCVITPKMQYSKSKPMAIVDITPDNANTSFFKKHPGWNLGNMREGIKNLDDTVSMVKKDHPVITVFNTARAKKGMEPLDLEQSTHGYLSGSRVDIERCVTSIESRLQKNQTVQNLHDMKFSIARAYTDQRDRENHWLDGTEIYEGSLSSKAKERIATENHSLYVGMRIQYMNM